MEKRDADFQVTVGLQNAVNQIWHQFGRQNAHLLRHHLVGSNTVVDNVHFIHNEPAGVPIDSVGIAKIGNINVLGRGAFNVLAQSLGHIQPNGLI